MIAKWHEPVFEGPDMTLEEVRNQVVESRQALVKALERHDAQDGEVIVQKFLTEFLAPETERSATARQFAAETIDLIEAFGSEAAHMAQSAVILDMKMESVVLGIAARIAKAGMDLVGTPNAAKEFAKAGEELQRKACEAGLHAAEIQRLAAGIIDVRTLTLRAFREENLQVSITERVERLRKEVDEDAKEQLTDEAWEAAKKAAKEVGDLVIDEAPILRWIKIAKRAKRILGGKKIDTSPGGTDEMLRLLEQLRKENKAIGALESSYEEALARLDALSR